MKRRTLVFASFLLILALLIGGCNPVQPPVNQPGPQEPVSEAPVETSEPVAAPTLAPAEPAGPNRTVGTETVTVAFNQEFDALNPLYASALSAQMVYDVWNCRAWNFDDKNNAQPILVKEIPSQANGGISADNRQITFKLRDDLVWSDGTPITGDDFVFTSQMMIDTKNNFNVIAPYDSLESVTAPDDKTVVVTYKEANAAWLYALWHVILPKHILEPIYAAQGTLENAEWNKNPTVSCGPFIFSSWEAGQSVTFKTNEKYWLDYPKVGSVVMKFYPEDAAKARAIIAGEADLSVFLIDGANQAPILRKAGMQILQVDSGFREGMFFFLDPVNGHPGLQELKVRQAIASGIDKEAIIREVYKDAVKPAISYWDNTPYIDPSLTPVPYDPEKAKTLLDEAGWVDTNGDGTRDKDGVELALTYGTTTSTVRQAVQAAIQNQLKEIGIGVELFNIDSGAFFSTSGEGGPTANGQFDLFEYSLRTTDFPDPSTNDFLCSRIPSSEAPDGENWSYLCNEQLDELFKLQLTQINPSERQQTFHQISKLIYDQVYFIGLWTDPDYWAANPRLLNVQISGTTPFFNITAWEIKP